MRKNFKIFQKKGAILILILALITGCFVPVVPVIAASSTTALSVTFRDNNANYGKIQYSLDDGSHWDDVTETIQEMAINVTGNNLRLKIVPNENYTVDYAGIELYLDNERVNNESTLGLENENGYIVPSDIENVQLVHVEFRYEPHNNDQHVNEGESAPEFNTFAKVSIHIEGEELEYDQPWSGDAADFIFGINNSPEMKRLSKNEVNYIRENDTIVGLETKEPINYQYDYNNEETVTFHIRTQWDDLITLSFGIF